MSQKTPKFGSALSKILTTLKPHTKNCNECQKKFEIFTEDIEFYKKLQVPPPTLCPRCRLQRNSGSRLSFFPIFYKKSCNVSGHSEKIIAFYSELNSVKVYDNKYYHSDKWSATEFEQDIDLEKKFFPKVHKFFLSVPREPLNKDLNSINSDYAVASVEAKNCYYVSVPINSEKVYYSFLPVNSKDSVQNVDIEDSTNCFDCALVKKSYKCISVVESSDCVESSFLYDCKNCMNCFMSSNLRNGQYYFCNKKLSKQEYQEKIKKINLGKKSVYEVCKKEFEDLINTAIKKNLVILKSDNCTGDNIFNSRNSFLSFNLRQTCENLRYVYSPANVKDSMDCMGGISSSLMYETVGFFNCDNSKFSSQIRQCTGLEYCSECVNCENCFACFGLKNKKYHIFNKAYSENEYWEKVDELKTKMLERGEYGEFFPLKDSPFPYQDSNAQVEFPLTEKEIKEKGWHWQDKIETNINLSKINTLKLADIPDDIHSLDTSIFKKAIICEKTGKPFKVFPFEIEFYKKMNVPLPTLHPLERIKELLFKYRRPYRLYDAACGKCQKNIQTVYNPEKTGNIYCEDCYKKKII